jgi:hypothetical protein
MVGLTASLLLFVPLLQLMSLAASIKSYVMFYQRAGSIWAFVVRESKSSPKDMPTAGTLRGPSEAYTPLMDIDHGRHWLIHLLQLLSRLTERQGLAMILQTQKPVRNEIHRFSSPMCPVCRMMRPRILPFSYCWEPFATSTSPCTI